MNILFLTHNTPGRNARGGGLVFSWQNIMSLVRLGHEVHLVIAEPNHPLDADLRDAVASVTYCTPVSPNARSLDRLLARVFRPETMMFRFPDWMGVRAQVEAALTRVGPELVWADWIGSLLRLPEDRPPIVYGHLDFIHQLKAVRRRVHAGRIRRPDPLTAAQLERVERRLVSACDHAVTVSATDAAIFERLHVPSTYMPVVGQPIPAPQHAPPSPPRAFLLGRSNTAMNAARRALRDQLWPKLGDVREQLSWHQLGEVPTQRTELWRWVESVFTIHGYVEDLGEVLRPTDLCLVPYRDDTGFRAKFVTAAGYGMVNIGYVETFACAEEFAPGENCLAARDDAHFVELLRTYAEDAQLRERLSRASRATYERRFGLEAQLPTYETILNSAIANSSARRRRSEP